MGNSKKVVTMPLKKQSRKDISQEILKQRHFREAIQMGIELNGIDYYKVLTGDEKENRKLEMKKFQDTVNYFGEIKNE